MLTITSTEASEQHTLSSRSRAAALQRHSSNDASGDVVPQFTAVGGNGSLRLNSSNKSLNTPRILIDKHSDDVGEIIQMGAVSNPGSSKNGSTKAPSILEGTNEDIPATGFSMSIRDERLYLATLCFCLFIVGWNDGTLGPLLPRIQAAYGIGYTVVSVLFVCNCVGNICGALSNVHLTDRLGFGKLITLAAAGQVVTYAVMAAAPPFPVMCVAYFFNGFAISLLDAQSSAFIASIPRNSPSNLGILHSIYGLGGFAAPLIATQFAQSKRWSFHFIVSLSLSLLNTVLLLHVFRLKNQAHFISDAAHPEDTSPRDNKYKQILGNKSVQLMAFFIMVYVGAGVTIGGWIFTYLLSERSGGPSAGYVSSGFYGGLTLGRLILLPINAKLGNERVIYVYSVLCIGLELTVWFVPNLIGNAVAVSIIGLLMGPFYPIAMTVISGLVPKWILAGSIGYIGALGQAGAAVFPFMTGALASKRGVKVLQPLLVAMMATLIALWILVTHSKVSRAD